MVRKSGFRVIDVGTHNVLTVTGQELTPGVRVFEISEDSPLKSGISGIQRWNFEKQQSVRPSGF